MKLTALVASLVVCCVALSAQQRTATITGTLLDPNGKPIGNTGNTVHARNNATQAELLAPVSPTGEYKFEGVPPGTYEISVPTGGAMYAAYLQKDVTVSAGTMKLDLHIEWGMNLGTIGDDPVMLMNDMRAKAKTPTGPAPRLPDGKPDFSGLWVPVFLPGRVDPPPLQPWAADVLKKLQDRPGGFLSPQTFCLPMSAMPFTLPFPHKVVHTSTLIVQMSEFDTPGYRQIFLDGRPHPEPNRWNPSWAGHSIGKWEGDTLVVDTVGFNELAGGVSIHTEKLHIVERIQRLDMGHLQVDTTVEDPDAYLRPWTRKMTLELKPDEEILEFICAENNKDPLHFGGIGYYIVRPPEEKR